MWPAAPRRFEVDVFLVLGKMDWRSGNLCPTCDVLVGPRPIAVTKLPLALGYASHVGLGLFTGVDL